MIEGSVQGYVESNENNNSRNPNLIALLQLPSLILLHQPLSCRINDVTSTQYLSKAQLRTAEAHRVKLKHEDNVNE